MEEERFPSAEYYLNEALRILTCIHGNESEAGNIMFKLASLYLKHKNSKKAITFFEKCLLIEKEIKVEESKSVIETYMQLGLAHDIKLHHHHEKC